MRSDTALTTRVASSAIPSLTVGTARGGERVIACGGTTPVTPESPYRIASLTKPFTSAAVVLSFAARDIPLSVPAIDLVPALRADWRADPAITVEQLLGQVAGLRPSVDAAAVAGLGDGDDALAEAARLVVSAGSKRAPAERWEYYNGNYFLLGAILSAVTGTSYERALEDSVLRPWGLRRTGFATPGASAAPVPGWDRGSPVPPAVYPRGRRPSGGLWSCLADLLTFAQRSLDPALVQHAGRPRTHPSDPMTYGLGWALGLSGQLYLNGRLDGYRTAMLLVPGRDYASVALANEAGALPEIAGILSDLQRPLTGDDLAAAIDAFAA
ncbi:MAG TPA: serine hydrolase domain-containing protein [Trebonia sp.]|nr:serine hydrolase domain-containing protein [Trebonia sp.]